MFSVYGDDSGKRGKHASKATIAVSVLAHVAAIGGLVMSARYAEAKPVKEVVINEWVLPEKPVEPPPAPPLPPPPPPPPVEEPPQPKEPPKVELAKEPEPPRPPRARPQPPAPVKGNFVALRPPRTAPVGIPAPDMNARPITQEDVSGIGKEGDVVGTVDVSDTRAPTGHTEPAPPTPDPAPVEPTPPSNEPMAESAVDVRPSLRNAGEMQRALERVYPEALRTAGVTGQTMLQFVIDENGRVESGSVEIVSSTNDEFAAAARRIVGSMRFSPAKSGGRSVRVTTTIPVTWTIGR